jgi:hypothetical protein
MSSVAAPRTNDATPSRRTGRAAAWLPTLSAVALVVAATAAVLAVGRGEAARGARVLSGLDPFFLALRTRALPLLEAIWTRRSAIGVAVAAAAGLLALVALLKGRRAGIPVALASAAAALATWGELLLLSDRFSAGWALYGTALVAAAAAGALAPLSSVPLVPRLSRPDAPRSDEEDAPGPPGWSDAGLLLVLLLLALGSRAWAINQLPEVFDDEMIAVQTQSRTAFGLAQFLKTEFVGTSNGLVTPLANRAVYAALGVSITSMRVTALLWGLIAVGLFWALSRRLLGGLWGPAGVTLLFIGAPEQLFWSRSEVSIFAPMAVIGLLFANAGLAMTGRFGAGKVLLAALLTPLCRFFYTAAHVLVVYPFFLAGHAMVFVRGAARRALASLPVLGGGIALWIVSVSAAISLVTGAWTFVHPARVRGEEAWRAGLPPETPPAAVAKAQAERFLSNLKSVAAGLTYHEAHATHWYERFHVSPRHNTTIGIGLAVLAALGLGWLLGQPVERRSALLLFWLGLGLLPGCLSDEPEARRNAVMFTPLLLMAGVFVVAAARLARARAGRVAGGLAAAFGGAVLLSVAATGFASHLLLPIRPIQRDEEIRFAAPLFARSDTVLHNLFYREGKTVAFGQLDRLLSPGGPCTQYVPPDAALLSALEPTCDFREEVFGLTLSPASIEARRKAATPRKVGYLLTDTPSGRELLAVLRAVHPLARVTERRFDASGETLVAVETDATELVAARPVTEAGAVHGGLLVPRDGWWEARTEPPCPGAVLAIGADGWDGKRERPLLAGLHPFRVTLPPECTSPLRVGLVDVRSGVWSDAVLVAPRLAALPEARAPEAILFPGYGAVKSHIRLGTFTADFGVGRDGRVFALLNRDFVWHLVVFAPDGREAGSVRPELPRDPSTGALAVTPGGGVVAFALNAVEVYDAALVRQARWELPQGVVGSDLALLSDGRIAITTSRRAVEIFSTEGGPEGTLSSWNGGQARFVRPASLAAGPGGLLAVAELDGEIHLFRLGPRGVPPEHVRSFRPAYGVVPFADDLRGLAFDGPDRLFVPYNPERPAMLLDTQGRRLMAATAAADLSAKGLMSAFRFVATPSALYAVDRDERNVWIVARLSP